MTAVVITDSIASLPKDEVNALGIQIAPLFLNYRGRQIEEGSLTSDELFSLEVKTSAPSPGSFINAIEQACTAGDGAREVLILTASSQLSTSYKSALIAAGQAAEEDSGGKGSGREIRVIDTQNASAGQGLLVLAVARAAKEGRPLAELTELADKISPSLRLMGVISDVSYLVKTGRIPQIAGWAGKRLGFKPLFEIRQGRIKKMLPARSLKLGHKKMAEICLNSRPDAGSKLHLAALHSESYDEAVQLQNLIEDSIKPKESHIVSFSQGLAASAGKGVSGAAWYWK